VIMKNQALNIILFVSMLTGVRADTLSVQPYAHWTFETAVEQIVFLESGPGYPIYMIRTEDEITLFDHEGEELRKIYRAEEDEFVINNARTGFMLVQNQPVAESDREEHLYSFQVFNSQGAPDYTTIYKADYTNGELVYQLTDKRGIMLTEKGKPWLLELSGDDTLLYIDSVQPEKIAECEPFVLASTLKLDNEIITAATCLPKDSLDPTTVELRIWNGNVPLRESFRVDGELHGVQGIPGSDYFFLELDHGDESSLTLINRSKAITSYPWKSWEIRSLGQEEAFIISETDLNVINLGDGALSATYHPIELRGISDAAYMREWGIFLYLRYNLFFNRDGKQAFRNFVLEGVDRSGQLVHRSSFGTWSTILPKISPVGIDKFAIHIHNSVFLYEITDQPY